MSRSWNRKSNLNKRNRRLARRRTRRRPLLECLEGRRMMAADGMAGDVMAAPADGTPHVVAAHHGDSTANPGHHAAHPAAMALISPEQVTDTAAVSGRWSDPSTWQSGTLPAAGARIMIPHGVSVTVDSVMAEEFKTIGIHGTLRFATNVNTELRVDTIVSSPSGRFEMGTTACPIESDVTAKVVFVDDGAIDTSWDPEQLSRGAILQGTTEIRGAATTHRVTLAQHPAAGARGIELTAAPTNWNVGDEIVVTGTQGATSDEVRLIESISGSSVVLDRALELDHIPPKADLNVYVANLTRNVQISSESSEVSRRGHIMLMHTLNANVQNAELDDLGRTDKSRPLDDIIFEFADDAVGNDTSAPVVFAMSAGEGTNVRGRYPLHFHRGGNTPGSDSAVVGGSVVNGSPGWGFVNHSSNVAMIDNVAYGVEGAAFYTEAGDEIGSMVGNIAIRTVSPTFQLDDGGAIDPDLRTDVQDFGVDGDGFWLTGHMVSMRGNVSAGASAHGIIIWSDGVVEADRGRATVRVADVANGHLITGRETIPTWWAPLAEITDNESYGATIGFRSRYVHSAGYLGEIGSPFHTPPDQAYVDTLNPVVDGLIVWGSRDGVLLNYNERLSLRNARLIGVGAPYVQNGGTADTGVGVDMYNEVSRGPGVIENVSIEGFNMGLLAPRNDGWQIRNLQLRNTTDMLITEPRQAARVLEMTSVSFETLAGTAVEGQEGQRRNIVLTADFDADAHQPYSFLLSDRITLDGQQIFFNEQAADFVPLQRQIEHEGARVPAEMIGQTNQQLHDRYGTSFGGAIIPADANAAEFVVGGVVGSLAAPAATYPPLYHMASEGAAGVLVDPGTLTNFPGTLPGPVTDDDNEEGDDPEDDAEPDDGADDEPADEDGIEPDEPEDEQPEDEDDDTEEEDGDEDTGDEDTDDGDADEDEPGEEEDEDDAEEDADEEDDVDEDDDLEEEDEDGEEDDDLAEDDEGDADDDLEDEDGDDDEEEHDLSEDAEDAEDDEEEDEEEDEDEDKEGVDNEHEDVDDQDEGLDEDDEEEDEGEEDEGDPDRTFVLPRRFARGIVRLTDEIDRAAMLGLEGVNLVDSAMDLEELLEFARDSASPPALAAVDLLFAEME